MTSEDFRLSGIETLWSVVRLAHDSGTESQSAQQQLLDRYGEAIRRYLLGALRNPDAADDVFQEFAVRFVRGDFKNADPDRGQFRSFLKTSLYRLIVDYQRRETKDRRNKELAEFIAEDRAESQAAIDVEFDRSWRIELLANTWASLEREQVATAKPYFTVLRLRADHDSLTSKQLANLLTGKLKRPINAGNARLLLHRARERFADQLLGIVEQSLADPTDERLEDELIALDLHDYCRLALEKRRSSSQEKEPQ